MADLNSDGLGDLVKKLNTAKELVKSMSTEADKFAKNMEKATKASGKGSGASGTKGGQKGNGQGGKVHDTSGDFDHGSMSGQSDMGKASFGDKVKGAAGAVGAEIKAQLKGKSLVTGTASALGLANVRQPDFTGIGPRTKDDQDIIDNNQRLIDRGKSRYFGAHGISYTRFSAQSPESQARIMSSMYGPADTLKLMSGMQGAFSTFLPNVGGTMDRAASYYNATTYGGNAMTRNATEAATFGTLQKMQGLTSTGSDANVAQYLASRGMTVSDDKNSTYQQTIRAVGNAGRYMNISNEDAAASIEGLTSAKGSSEMLRNFGIYTADLATGKEKSTTQIFEEVAQRLTAGRGQASVEQTQASIRRGALGVTADAFFADPQTNQMFKQYMVERARGKGKSGFDLSGDANGSNPLDKVIGSADNLNPNIYQMAQSTSETGAMGQATESYTKGIAKATAALGALTAVAGGLAKAVGGANAMIQTFFGNNSAKGLVEGVSTVVDFGSKAISGIGEALMGMDALNPAPAIAEAGIIAGSAAMSLGTVLATGAGAALIGGFGGGNGKGVGSNASMFSSMSQAMGDGSSDNNINPNIGTIGFNSPSFQATNSFFDRGLTTQPSSRGPEGAHRGYDYTGYKKGDPIRVIGDGIVVDFRPDYKGQDYATSLDTVSGSIGNFVVVKHTLPNGKVYSTSYGHLNSVDSKVKMGAAVKKGQVIGTAGNTGGTWPMGDAGVHLHFELHSGVVGFEGGRTKSLSPSILANIALDATPTGAGLVPGSSGGNSSGVPDGTTGEGGSQGVNSAMQQGNSMLSKIQGSPSMTSSMASLTDIYSGDETKILGAFKKMAANMGMDSRQYESISKATELGSAGAYAPWSPTTPGPGGNSPTNNVSINVTVPDVTAADAMQFATLVKQFLDDNSLLSNAGRL
jgi:murein DD-endopeptidase MepM/ murein hydrolase activator NlpD